MMHIFRATSLIFALTALTASPILIAAEQTYNQVSLRAEAQREVAHDQMEVILYTEDQDSDAARLAQTITNTLNDAITQARHYPQVSIKQGSRRSYPVHDSKHQTITAWRERAELRLESTDFSALSTLTAELLKTLKMSNMQFSIAAQTRLRSEDQLLQEAIGAFQARAKLISEALGSSSYKIVQLNLNSSGFAQPPMYARSNKMLSVAMADEAAVIPEVEGGSSQVSIIADGVIEVALP